MEQFSAFTGRFHPLLVHLPIGFLLIAVVFIWIKESGKVVKISIGLGAIAAIASVITGLLLAEAEGYASEVQLHKYSGIALTVVGVAMYFVPERFWKSGSVVMVLMILLTGHFGGTLTHGSLIPEAEADNLDISKLDFDNAIFYDDAVKPIFEARCVSCHGNEKQKGGLRLDNEESIARGGKHGKIIVSGNPEESELVKRLDLPLDHEDHMPPKEKLQLTDPEKKLISLWVASGSDFTKKISESLKPEQIKELNTRSASIELPDVDVAAPAEQLIKKLTEQNVAITPVARESNFLQVSFITVPNEAAQLIQSLTPIAKNIVWLKLNNADIGNVSLGEFENLTELNLSNTKVDDAMMDEILKCRRLVSLNLAGTKITTVAKLKQLANLRYLNVYNTSIRDADLPGATVERGNYSVPTFESDTTRVKGL